MTTRSTVPKLDIGLPPLPAVLLVSAFLWALAVAGCTVLLPSANAQLTPIGQMTIAGPFRPGYTNAATSNLVGYARWNPAFTSDYPFVRGRWEVLSITQSNTYEWAGVGGGTGSGFPLLDDGDLNGFSLTNGFLIQADRMQVGTLVFDVVGTNVNFGFQDLSNIRTVSASNLMVNAIGAGPRLPFAYVTADDTDDGHFYQYGPRALLTSTELNAQRLADTNATLYPGQLVRALQGSAAGSVYISTNPIVWSDFVATNTGWMPGMVQDQYWKLFSAKGSDGASGAAGPQGGDGLGNIRVGAWQYTFAYDYDTNSIWWVRYGGRLYELIATGGSSNQVPTLHTSVWAIAVDKGADGSLTITTNVIDRGAWTAGETYTNNHQVYYYGNTFRVGETNVAPAPGVAPTINGDWQGVDSANWSLVVGRGERGVRGPSGAVTTYQTFQSYEYLLFDPTNTVILNLPHANTNQLEWVSESDGTNYFQFVSPSPGTTNVLELKTAETDTSLVLKPDGANGVVWGEDLGGFSNVVTEGSGNAVTGVVASGSTLTVQLGEVAAGSSTDTYLLDGSASINDQPITNGAEITIAAGGLTYWQEDTGTATQAGAWFAPTGSVVGFFVGTNDSVSLSRPDGTVVGGGAAIGQRAVSLVPYRANATERAQGSHSVAVGSRARSGNNASVAIGFAAYAAGSGIYPSVAIGQNAQSAGLGAVSIGYGTQASGGNSSVAIGDGSYANTGDGGIAIGRGNLSSAAGTISFGGRRAKASHAGSCVITGDTGDYDKTSATNNSIAFSYSAGAYFRQTNTTYASITPSGYSIGDAAGITVTQIFLDASSNIRTNIFIGGILVSGYTE